MSGLQLDEKLKRDWLDVVPRFQAAAGKNSKDHGFWNTWYALRGADLPEVLKKELEDAIKAQKIALMHGELSELMEVYRKDPEGKCDKVPSISKAEEEAADLLIRLLDFCASVGLRLALATLLKMEFNAGRPFKHGRNY